MTFEAGKSGNPGGKAPVTSASREAMRLLQDLSARNVRGLAELLDELAEVRRESVRVGDQINAIRVEAQIHNGMLDRSLGKPAQQVQHTTAADMNIRELPRRDQIAILSAKVGDYSEAIAHLQAEEARAQGQMQ